MISSLSVRNTRSFDAVVIAAIVWRHHAADSAALFRFENMICGSATLLGTSLLNFFTSKVRNHWSRRAVGWNSKWKEMAASP